MHTDPPQPNSVEDIIKLQRSFLHDMATPLSIVLGMLDMILSQPDKLKTLDQKEISRLQKALDAAQRMETLLKANRKTLCG